MEKAIRDGNLKLFYRCPKHKTLVLPMTTTHPWRLYCDECREEYQNPDHPEYYAKEVRK